MQNLLTQLLFYYFLTKGFPYRKRVKSLLFKIKTIEVSKGERFMLTMSGDY